MPVDEEVIDDETKLTPEDKAWLKNIAKENLLSDLSIDELLTEIGRRWHELLRHAGQPPAADDTVVATINPIPYQNQERT